MSKPVEGLKSNRKSGIFSFFIICLTTALMVTFVESVMMAKNLTSAIHFESLGRLWGYTTVLYGVIYVVLFLLAAVIFKICSRAFSLDWRFQIAIAVFFIAAYLPFFVINEMEFGEFPHDGRFHAVVIGTFLLAALVSRFVYQLLGRDGIIKRQKRLLGIAMGIPVCFAELSVLFWVLANRTFYAISISSGTLWGLGAAVILISWACMGFVFPRRMNTALIALLFCFCVVYSVGVSITQNDEDTLHAVTDASAMPVHRVILIVDDTLRADALGCINPDTHSPTPNIDSLAADSIVFTQAYSPAPWTFPAMISMMTGQSPLVHKSIKVYNKLSASIPTLAELMLHKGYTTGAIGSNAAIRRCNLDKGFQHYDFYPKPGYYSLIIRAWQKLFKKRIWRDASTDDLTNLSMAWMNKHQKNPFFLWLHYYDPHMPYTPPERFLPNQTPPPRIGKGLTLKQYPAIRFGWFWLTPETHDWIKILYNSEVRYVDENVGRLLDYLKKQGLYDDSLIIFISDHGEELWDHEQFEHGHSVHREVIHVPLIIKLPHSTQKSKIDIPVCSARIMPTILDLCHIPYDPKSMTETSLIPVWSGQEQAKPILSTGLLYFCEQISLIFDDYQYIKYLMNGHEELYQLSTDPDTQASLVNAKPKVLEEARKKVSEYQMKAKAISSQFDLSDRTAKPDKDTLKKLKSLGYTQ